MKRAWIGVGLLLGFFLLAMFLLADAEAQTVAPSLATAPHAGAFDRLSPGNQKIAQALFEAQQSPAAPGAPKPLSLNDIAAMKQSGRGWGVIFTDMKQQGLVTDRNLGQAVSRFNHEHRVSSSGGAAEITTASGKTWVVDRPGSRTQGAQGKSAKSEESDRGGASTSAAGQTTASGHGGGVGAGRGGSSGGHGK